MAVLSYQTWRTRFHGAAHILGTSIQLGPKPYFVIGVMPRGFEFPLVPGQLNRSEIWVPASITKGELENGSGEWSFGMVARLKQGVTPSQAQQDVRAVTAREIHRSYKWHTGCQAARLCHQRRRTATDAHTVAGGRRGYVHRLFQFRRLTAGGGHPSRAGTRCPAFARRAWIVVLRQNLASTLVLSLSGGLFGLGFAMILLRVGTPHLPETMPRSSGLNPHGLVSDRFRLPSCHPYRSRMWDRTCRGHKAHDSS